MRLFPLALVLLAGCTTTATEMYGPNGEPLVDIDCSADSRAYAACYQKAEEVCPDGYRLIERISYPRMGVIVECA